MTCPKTWKNWIDICSDVNWEDYHGMWGIRVDVGEWYVIKFTNLLDCVGEFELGDLGRFDFQVCYCNLNEISSKELRSVRNSFNIDSYELATDIETALIYGCVNDGLAATLETISGNSWPMRLRASAKRCTESYIKDNAKLENELDQPFNAIGTTKRQQSQGNYLGGLRNYAIALGCGAVTGRKKEDQTKNLMLKIYGVDTVELKKQAKNFK